MADIIKSISAEILVHRAKEKLKPCEDSKEFEVDRFFYWVLGQVDGGVEFEWPAPKKYYVALQINSNKDRLIKIPCVKSRTEETYYANFVEGNEFFDVMREVEGIFNEMKNYRAESIIDEEQGIAKMKVYLEL